jgi:hypothetical protein
MERALLCQIQCHMHQEGNFRSSRKILCSSQLSKSRIPYFRPDGLVMRLDTLQCLEDSDKLSVASVLMSGQHVRTLFSVREGSSFPLQTRIVTTQFFFFWKHKMSHYSGTTICHSANILYTFHNMYLIIRVTSTLHITHNNIINIAEGTSINNT